MKILLKQKISINEVLKVISRKLKYSFEDKLSHDFIGNFEKNATKSLETILEYFSFHLIVN